MYHIRTSTNGYEQHLIALMCYVTYCCVILVLLLCSTRASVGEEKILAVIIYQ